MIKPLLNQKGIALLVALVAMTLLMAIAHEISYDVTVEYVVNSQSVQRVKAHWAARSGMELSLLRIKMFQKAQIKYKNIITTPPTNPNSSPKTAKIESP